MDYHHWLEAFHIISVISWMAGMLYLPRLYAYHSSVEYDSKSCRMLQVMEKRLLRIIINPAMISTITFGMALAIEGSYFHHRWFHVKVLLVLIMLVIHMLLARYRKLLVNGKNKHSAFFYKVINEIVTLLMSLIVIIATVKPF